tara:strand:+ start:10290 stop:13001 length:2712 start_codon:yes stop_codon:yes gene_type:complete
MDFTDLFHAIKNETTVVTVNQRLARHLSSTIDQAYLEQGATSWLSPSIMSYDAWLLSLWQQRFDLDTSDLDSGDSDTSTNSQSINKTLLNPEQVLTLWQQVINDSHGSELLNVAATAKAANKAHQLASQWDINPALANPDQLDLVAFSDWRDSYLTLLNANQWIDQPALFGCLFERFEQGLIDGPAEVILAGFDVFTPQQKQLWQLLQQKGCSVDYYEPYDIKSTVKVLITTDLTDEDVMIAQWAREQLQANPTASIGIVVPELESRRQGLERAFMQSFYPSLSYAVDLPLNKPYNVSLGRALSQYPPIQQSLRLLDFCQQRLPLNELSQLLRSPYLAAGHAEWTVRGRLELRLRKRDVLQLGFTALHNWLTPADGDDSLCPQLLLALNQVQSVLQSKPNRAIASEWAMVFRRLLSAFAVQGDRELGSLEYQLFQAWDNLLRSFAALDRVSDLMTFNNALALLKRMSHERVFQAETPVTPIQIMGLMEVAGHRFDALWVCGLHDSCWPPAPQPQAFLPIMQQRHQGLVQSSADLQYKLAKQQTMQWARSADTVVFSYATANADKPLKISPLIATYPLIDRAQLLTQLPIDSLAQRVGSRALLTVDDQKGSPLPTAGVSRGGVGILTDQAACPFKAFAHKRLLAEAMPQPEPGIDARLRGSLVHSALEAVWQRIKTQQQLLALTTQQRRELVEAVVAEIMAEQSPFKPILRSQLGRMEAQRISALLMDWLVLDSAREPFTVMATELKQTLSLGKLQINTSIDRLDSLADGSSAIIDYKTGTAALSSWFGERPKEPQLPLYGVFGHEGVHSLGFAQVKKGALKYIGVTDCHEHFSALNTIDKVKGSQGDWAAQMAYWHAVMTNLANQFVAGDARVEPTREACEYCDLTSLCRINEQQLLEVDADE